MIRRLCRDTAGFLIFWGAILGALIIVSPQ